MYKNLSILIIGFFLFGCSTAPKQLYKENKLPPEKVVIIEGRSISSSLDCLHIGEFVGSYKICAFDNVEIESCQRIIEFLPGEHVLRIEHVALGITMINEKYKLNFSAGERYCLGLNTQYTSQLELEYLGKYNKDTGKIEGESKNILLYKHRYK